MIYFIMVHALIQYNTIINKQITIISVRLTEYLKFLSNFPKLLQCSLIEDPRVSSLSKWVPDWMTEC